MTIFDGKIDDTRHIPSFLIESTVFAVSGLMLGAFIDKNFKKLSEKYPKYKLPIAAIQLLLLIVLVAVMYMFLRSEFALHFQRTLPGMAFPAMYFGVQANIFEAAESLF